MKRLFDLILSLIFLVLVLPVCVMVAFAVLLERTGPVFFLHERIGLGGKPFNLIKFRSMAVGAEMFGHSTSVGDSRITRVGTFIRKWSLDELPQLWNVLMGDMSLVGPRPDVLAQKQNYADSDWKLRCSVRPGITGEAQVRFRSNCKFEERCFADLEYVTTPWSLTNDLRILWATFSKIKSY